MFKPFQIPVALLLGALALPAFGQTQSTYQPRTGKRPPAGLQPCCKEVPVPDYMRYQAFFKSLWSFDNQGHRAYVAGDKRRSEAWHSYVKWDARLTARENEVLKAIAADCLAQIEAFESAWRAAHPGLRPPLDEATAKDLKVAKEKYARVILEHVDQLKTAFGPKRFAHLDRYIRYTTRNLKAVDDGSGN